MGKLKVASADYFSDLVKECELLIRSAGNRNVVFPSPTMRYVHKQCYDDDTHVPIRTDVDFISKTKTTWREYLAARTCTKWPGSADAPVGPVVGGLSLYTIGGALHGTGR